MQHIQLPKDKWYIYPSGHKKLANLDGSSRYRIKVVLWLYQSLWHKYNQYIWVISSIWENAFFRIHLSYKTPSTLYLKRQIRCKKSRKVWRALVTIILYLPLVDFIMPNGTLKYQFSLAHFFCVFAFTLGQVRLGYIS